MNVPTDRCRPHGDRVATCTMNFIYAAGVLVGVMIIAVTYFADD
jgi:hypothetical protein